uniref:Uncharacterized protein n=1 Tax=Oryza brachyantha TaxID=4533 RepID=J3ME43_ORYBR
MTQLSFTPNLLVVVEVEGHTKLCSNENYWLDEDGTHLFFKRKDVKRVWWALNMENVQVALIECRSAYEMVDTLLQLEKKELCMASTMLWLWWQERNRIREGERRRDAGVLGSGIIAFTMKMLKLSDKEQCRQRKPVHRWEKPVGDAENKL